MALDNDIRLFLQIPLFRMIGPDALRLVAFSAQTKLFRAGEILASAPHTIDGGYLLVDGAVGIFNNAEQTGQPEKIARPPLLIGACSLITPTEFIGSVAAYEPSTVLHISRANFHRVLNEYPHSAQSLRTALVNQLIQFTDDLRPLILN